ncbi:hypothetical protein K491DRAFT_715066 [Lophiostoma macrostomum CBS 122681]|uniref:BTB domain-containing protein n=1 Tax=Lophiostoma macrostomum CBS 122681 TaxID=1314788 RepID=A0A6A6TAQ4_9PLEO|nr:hypothetical protein K491DRAFT_715066 [Lophiostoma macrostomum CBS 122681]
MDEPSKTPPAVSTAARGDAVTIEVGPDRRKYLVHKDLLTHHSEYFRRALKEPWKESDRNGVTVLDDVEPGVFNHFVEWLYLRETEKAFETRGELDEGSSTLRNGRQDYGGLVIKLYIFADRFGISQLQNFANNFLAYHLISDGHPQWYETITHAFENIPSTRKLLRILVDVHCACWTDDHDALEDERALREMLPRDFLLRISLRYKEMLDGTASKELDAWAYYEFGSEEEKATWKKYLKTQEEDDEDNNQEEGKKISSVKA